MGANRHCVIDCFEFEPDSNIVEIGTDQGGGSTRFLADYARARRLNFWTVDINPQRIDQAARLGCHAVCAKGEDFLIDFGRPIHFAYLDNLDWMGGGMEVPANVASAQAHLLQARRLLQWMTAGVIVIDDTWLSQGFGKGYYAAQFLADSGFTVESGPGWLVLVRSMAAGRRLSEK
jgi:hypothetical protein